MKISNYSYDVYGALNAKNSIKLEKCSVYCDTVWLYCNIRPPNLVVPSRCRCLCDFQIWYVIFAGRGQFCL